MNETEARRVLYDTAMRRGLMSLLWACRMKEQQKHCDVPQPMPMMDDDQIKKELKRIIGFK